MIRGGWPVLIAGGLAIVVAIASRPVRAIGPAQLAPPASIPQDRAVLNQYCVSCHNQGLRTAGLALDMLDPSHPGENPPAWEAVEGPPWLAGCVTMPQNSARLGSVMPKPRASRLARSMARCAARCSGKPARWA